MSPVAPWLLAGLASVLAVVVGVEVRPAARDPVPVAPPSQASVPQPGPAPVATDGMQHAWLATILARPLFAPDRRPAAAGSAVALTAAAPTLPRIAGILVDGGRRSVIFAAAGAGRPVVVAEGAEMNGFRVQAIEPGQVTVLGPAGAQVLHPSFDPHPPAPAQPAAPAGPPGLPGLPSLQNLTGIPGLTAPALPVPSAR